MKALHVAPPFLLRNWVTGDSTSAGLSRAYDGSDGTNTDSRVRWLTGWPHWVAVNKLPHNLAVPGHYTWEVENDLFGTQAFYARTAIGGGGVTGPQPDQWSQQRHPDRIIITSGANEILNLTGFSGAFWSSGVVAGNYAYWHASLINQLLLHGCQPYVPVADGGPTRTVGDGICDFIILTIYPWLSTGGFDNNRRNNRAGVNSQSVTNFGEIRNPFSANGIAGGSNAATTAYTYSLQASPNGMPITLPSTVNGFPLRCMMNVDTVLQGAATLTQMDPKYNTPTDAGFGVHLNVLGEQTMAAAMDQFFLVTP